MGKRLVGVIRFHFQFLCFSYAELWYSCACVFEMFACVEHQWWQTGILLRCSPESHGRRLGGRTYLWCTTIVQKPGSWENAYFQVMGTQPQKTLPELTQSGVQSGWKNESLEFDQRFCFYLTKIIQNIRPIGSFPFFLVWRRLRCRWVACKEINPIDPTRGWIIHE